MDLQNRIREKSRQLDMRVKRSLDNRGYDFEAAEMRDLLDEILARWKAPLMYYDPDLNTHDFEMLMKPGYITNAR